MNENGYINSLFINLFPFNAFEQFLTFWVQRHLKLLDKIGIIEFEHPYIGTSWKELWKMFLIFLSHKCTGYPDIKAKRSSSTDALRASSRKVQKYIVITLTSRTIPWLSIKWTVQEAFQRKRKIFPFVPIGGKHNNNKYSKNLCISSSCKLRLFLSSAKMPTEQNLFVSTLFSPCFTTFNVVIRLHKYQADFRRLEWQTNPLITEI